jgi:oxaloacetate decarboxylase alpha subunit
VEKRQRSSEREAFRLIEEMLELMESRGLVELEMEHQGMRIRLKKGSAGPAPQVVEYVAGIPQQASAKAKAGEEARRAGIKSPMVGTFYRAPAPDAPAFAEVGQEIEVGQVVCIIEAMKLMNEIKSDVAGRITEVLVENGAPVEFGQPLFLVEPKR